MDEIKIRNAAVGDSERISELLAQIAALHRANRPDIFSDGEGKYNSRELKRILKNPEKPVLAAVDNKNVICGYAFCVLQKNKKTTLGRERKILYIDDLCVDEAARGRGIGTLLMDACMELARENCCDNVELNVWSFNKKAMEFYEKYGMTEHRRCMELTP
ncbi:MAG: GNAT family N-acetyltransferase [Clostridiales bacterium]|nr:GNAT family N-acetyltransferase [Clostridiales bacterium]